MAAMLCGLRSRILRPWTLMIVQKVQANGTAARSVGGGKTRIGEVFHCFRAGLGQRRIFDIDEILQILGEAIKRLQSAVQIVGENAFPFSLDFAGNDADALAIELLNVGLLIAQHVDGAAGVKAAHDHGDPFGSENFCHVDGARKLIGLDADQANQQV